MIDLQELTEAGMKHEKRVIDFVPRKYGRELLVDIGWVHQWKTFITGDEPHSLSFYEVLLLTSGQGRVWLDDREWPIGRGSLLFTAPGQIRRWRARRIDGICVFFTGAFIVDFFQDPDFLHRLQVFRHPGAPPGLRLDARAAATCRLRMEEMQRELGSLRGDSPHVLRAMLYELLVRLNRLYAGTHRLAGELEVEPFVLRFKRLLERRITRWHRVAQYAAHLKITPGHLTALSQRHFRQPAGAVIRSRLLAEAKRRLAYTDDSAAAIADALGFADASYFNRFFRREAQVSPARYRAAIREKHHPGRD